MDKTFAINNQPIESGDSSKHPGHVITSEVEYALYIYNRCNDFAGRVTKILRFFGNENFFAEFRFFRSYCTIFFGSSLPITSKIYALHGFRVFVRFEKYCKVLTAILHQSFCHCLTII
jgi:hypothetical protein